MGNVLLSCALALYTSPLVRLRNGLAFSFIRWTLQERERGRPL